MTGYTIRTIQESDQQQIAEILKEYWGTPKIISRGVAHNADLLPGFIAFANGRIIGVLTYMIVGDSCEIVTLNSLRENIGIGNALIFEAQRAAKVLGCKKLWLITTNDNLSAIRFYQKRGFKIAAIHVGAIEKSRQLKPEIPLLGNDDIPIRDEIEIEMSI
jgi:N-acetylglutamate synthase-like GNAT family acetyltransferase